MELQVPLESLELLGKMDHQAFLELQETRVILELLERREVWVWTVPGEMQANLVCLGNLERLDCRARMEIMGKREDRDPQDHRDLQGLAGPEENLEYRGVLDILALKESWELQDRPV